MGYTYRDLYTTQPLSTKCRVMLIDDLRSKLKDIQADIETIRSFWVQSGTELKLAELDAVINTEQFWQHPERDKLMSQHHALKTVSDTYKSLLQSYNDNAEMVQLFAEDEGELLKLKKDIFDLHKQVSTFKISLFMTEESDNSNCYLSINAGAGGTESQDWASMLLRMFLRFCERERFGIEVLDYQAGEEAGIKSATLYIKHRNATGFLKAEEGIHRLVRISPYDANKRRHTSFAAISVTPEVEDEIIDIQEKDLRIDTYRAGGAGGQHVNKTDSAVRITHLPSGIVVQCQSDRSQGRNKQTALKLLKARLIEKQNQDKRTKEQSKEKKKIEWGSQIRSYVLHPYKMVKDHRTDFESPQPEEVLDGDLMPFIEAYLVQSAGTN